MRPITPLALFLLGAVLMNGAFVQSALAAKQNLPTPVTIPLHPYTINKGTEQRLAIYVVVAGGKPRPYLFDTGSSVFEAVVGNEPYNPAKPVAGVTPIANLYGIKNSYPDFGYAYQDGNGFGGTLVHATVSFYAELTDATPIVTYTNSGGSGPIINALSNHYTNGDNPDATFWPSIKTNGTPLESNIVGTFGAGSFVGNNAWNFADSQWVNLSNGVTYGSVIGQVTKTGYIVDATSSNPVLIIGLSDQLTAQFPTVVPANLSTNPAAMNFPGSGAPSFDTREVTFQETLSGTNNTSTPGTNQSVILSNAAVLLDTGTADINAKIDAANNSNALLFVDTNSLVLENNTFSATAGGGTAFSITTTTNSDTYTVGTGEYTIGLGIFLQSSVLYDLQDGTIGFLNAGPLNPLTPPSYDHIVVVILENHGYSEVLGATLPFLNGVLRAGGADMTQSYSLQHPSQDNYYWLFSGANQGVAYDTAPTAPFTNAPNLYTEITSAGKTFAGYLDAYPGAAKLYAGGGRVVNGVDYVTRHVPWLGFSNVPAKVSRDFTTFGTNATSFSKLPAVSFVIPGLEHDMHDYATGQEVSNVTNSGIAMTNADTWLSNNLSAYAAWAVSNNSLLIVTTDEDSTADWTTPPNPSANYHGSNPVALTAPNALFSHTSTTTNGGAQTGPNQITTLFYGAQVMPGSYLEGNGITHVNVLRTIEWLCGISSGVGAQSSAVTTIGEAPVTDIFAGYTGSDKFSGITPNTNQWVVNYQPSNTNDVLRQNNGLHFIVPVIESSANAIWGWKTNAPTTSDWSASLTVTNLASSTISNAFCSIGLSARNPTNTANLGFSMSLGYDHMAGGPQWKASQDIGSNTSILTMTNSSVNKGAVLLTYTATNQTLTAAYSTNALSSKLKWINFASVTLADLSMATNGAASSFVIAISGDASGMKLGMTPAVSAGNFNLTSGATATTNPILLPQTITFPTINNPTTNPIRITLPTSNSHLPVTTVVQSGPATLTGNLLSFQGTGFVTLGAYQLGNDRFAAATNSANFFVSTPK